MCPIVAMEVQNEDTDEILDELDQNLKRLRIEYEQFFMGQMKREPFVLKGKVQKVIIRMVNKPPRNSRQKFRFNSLNAKFQVYRQLWGRTMRQIENGTYKRDKFKAKIQAPAPGPAVTPARRAPSKSASSVDKLHEAFLRARRQTGEGGGAPDAQALQRVVRQQMQAIRKKHGSDVKVKFKVVVENNKAKLKAQLSK